MRSQSFQTEAARNSEELGHTGEAPPHQLAHLQGGASGSPVWQEECVPVGLGKGDAPGSSRPGTSLGPADLTSRGCLENKLSTFSAIPLKVNS